MPPADDPSASPPVEWILDGLAVELRAVIARRWLTKVEAMRLSVGDVLTFPRAAVAPELELVVEGLPIASGELVDLEGERAVRIRKRLDAPG